MLLVLKRLSKTHTWLLPVFAVGLGAPRWCQVRLLKLPHDALLSSPDSVGYVLACPLHSLGGRCRTVSGRLTVALVGCAGCYSGRWFRNDSPTGMMHYQRMRCIYHHRFQTLSRLHVVATLAFSQVIGAICVMVARATAPNRIGPESVFPDAAKWDFNEGLAGPFFFFFFATLYLRVCPDIAWLLQVARWLHRRSGLLLHVSSLL
jgi:alpha-1,3-glucan synthase